MRLSGVLALSDFSKRLRQRQHDADGYGNRSRHIHSEHERESQVVPVFTDRSPHRGLADRLILRSPPPEIFQLLALPRDVLLIPINLLILLPSLVFTSLQLIAN